MYTREYKNYKRMTKMTVRFLENHDSNTNLNLASNEMGTMTRESIAPAAAAAVAAESEIKLLNRKKLSEPVVDISILKNSLTTAKKESTPTPAPAVENGISKILDSINLSLDAGSEFGHYTNWSSKHTTLTHLPWCCIGDLMAFCDKYEYRSINRNDPGTHNRIVTEVKTLLGGKAPFDSRKRFPGDIRSPENLWVCIGRCTGVEYHLNRILSIFRRPMDKLAADKQRIVRHDFHLAVNELRLDISARISEVRLYDRNIFERDFHLEWKSEPEKA